MSGHFKKSGKTQRCQGKIAKSSAFAFLSAFDVSINTFYLNIVSNYLFFKNVAVVQLSGNFTEMCQEFNFADSVATLLI